MRCLVLASVALIAAHAPPAIAQSVPATPPPLPVSRDAQGCWASAGRDPSSGINQAIGVDERENYRMRLSHKDWQFAEQAPVPVRLRATETPAPEYGPERNQDVSIEALGFRDRTGRSGLVFPLAGSGYNFRYWTKLSLFREGEAAPFAVVANPGGLANRSLRPCLMDLARDDRGSAKPVVTKVTHRNPGSMYITNDDYPSAALRARAQGSTRILLTVSAHGIVSDCAITETSSNADLDSATCSLLTRRARLKPALDEAGQPTQGTIAMSITWRIPS